MLERKVYTNDDFASFSVLMFARPSCDNTPRTITHYHMSDNTLSHQGLVNVNTQKRMFYLLIFAPTVCRGSAFGREEREREREREREKERETASSILLQTVQIGFKLNYF